MDNPNVEIVEESTIPANVFGCEPVTITVPANAVYSLKKLRDWKQRNLPENLRSTMDSFVEMHVLEAAQNAAQYAEDMAYKALEKLCFDIAKAKQITPQEAAESLKGFQLREK